MLKKIRIGAEEAPGMSSRENYGCRSAATGRVDTDDLTDLQTSVATKNAMARRRRMMQGAWLIVLVRYGNYYWSKG
jgi:hypothetical protein